MATTDVSNEVRDAALRGAIEILLNPEYGTDWIRNEVLRDMADEDATEEVAEQVDTLIMERFKAFAVSLVAELPVEKRVGLEYLSE